MVSFWTSIKSVPEAAPFRIKFRTAWLENDLSMDCPNLEEHCARTSPELPANVVGHQGLQRAENRKSHHSFLGGPGYKHSGHRRTFSPQELQDGLLVSAGSSRSTSGPRTAKNLMMDFSCSVSPGPVGTQTILQKTVDKLQFLFGVVSEPRELIKKRRVLRLILGKLVPGGRFRNWTSLWPSRIRRRERPLRPRSWIRTPALQPNEPGRGPSRPLRLRFIKELFRFLYLGIGVILPGFVDLRIV